MTSPPDNASAFEAAVQRAYVAEGYVRVIGEKTVDGRRALIVQNAAPKWRSDDADSKTVAVVDAETFALYERTTSHVGIFRQTERFEVNELLPAGGETRARMAMARHKGAHVERRTKHRRGERHHQRSQR
jgi:hypothetical protein